MSGANLDIEPLIDDGKNEVEVRPFQEMHQKLVAVDAERDRIAVFGDCLSEPVSRQVLWHRQALQLINLLHAAT